MKDINTLRRFRHDLSDCFPRAKDVLFNTIDALMTETQAKSFPEISQSPWFERKWSSLYEGFQDGRINEKRLREVFAHYRPQSDREKWLWIGIDASSIARPDAVTSADRTAQHVHNLPECKKPITFGWQFSTVVALADPASSWTYILDQQRVASQTTAIEVAEAQLRRLVPHLPKNTIVVRDRGYDANWLWCRCSALGIGVLSRLKNHRCLYRPAPTPTGKKGSPRKDGAKLQPKDPTTHGEPDGIWKGSDAKGRPVEITSWKRMHVKEARWLQVTVLRVVRPHATDKERDPRVSWFVWIGDQEADVFQIALGYVLRFGQEHGYRFDKQALLWDTPRLRTDIRSLSGGVTLSPLLIIIWCWLAIWLKFPFVRGKISNANRPRNKYDARGDGQIVGSFGYPCSTTTPPWKIERSQLWSKSEESSTFCCSPQNSEVASTYSIVTTFLTSHARFLSLPQNFSRSSARTT